MAEKVFKIFDSLAHPVLDSAYSPKGRDYSFATLKKLMSSSSVNWACAVGLYGKGGYKHEEFYEECKKHPELIAIAGFNPEEAKPSITEELDRIKTIGFKAIKIHPGICNLDINSEASYKCFEHCEKIGMPIFLCSYHYSSDTNANFYEKLYKLVSKFPEQKINIVHGGGVEVLKFSEMTRANKNLLLDLSFTILKYPDSSVEQDLEFLFNNFDQRICVGTDHPEFTPKELEEKVRKLSVNLSQEKIDNICHKNLANFLGLELNS